MMKPLKSWLVLVATLLAVLPQTCPAQEAAPVERPSAMQLFPYETAAFFRIKHAGDLYTRWQQTGVGAMLNDPDVAPLVGGLWSFFGDRFNEDAAEEAGFEWSDLSRIPQGEVAIGVVDRGETNLGVLVLADFDGNQQNVDFMLQLLDDRWTREAMVVEKQELEEGLTLTIVRRGDDRASSFGYLVKDTCLLGSNDETLIRQVLDRWAGRVPTVEAASEEESTTSDPAVDPAAPLPGERPLAKNPKFQTILKACSTQLDQTPQMVAYVDPILLVRRTTRGNVGASVVMATLPALGLDGLLAVGGTGSFATTDWDTLFHSHLLLENPRAGVMTLLRFEAGDITPPPYVPDDAINYANTYLDVPGIYDRAIQLYDKFRYEGAFNDEILEEAEDDLEINFRETFIDNATGRMTLVTSFDNPRRLQGEQQTLCIEFTDAAVVQQAIDKIIEKSGEAMEPASFGGIDFYRFRPFRRVDIPEEDRPFTPAIGMIENTLVLTMSTSLFEQMIECQQGTRARLADSIEYKVIQSRVERLTRGQNLVGIFYNNPASSFRHWVELSQADTTRDRLSEFAENSSFADGMLRVMEENELPEFDELESYFAPTGGYLLDTNTGLHLMMFNMGRELPEE